MGFFGSTGFHPPSTGGGGGGGDKTFVFDQPTPATVWYINHNLNKFCSVTIVDSAKTVWIGQVQYVDANNCVVSFNIAVSGYAYCN